MSEKLAWVYGVFRIPLKGDEVQKFIKEWRKFLEAFEGTEDLDFYTTVVKSQWDGPDARLIDAVLAMIDDWVELGFDCTGVDGL